MSEQDNNSTKKLKTWDGGHSPFKASYGKLMMWFFLVSDALTFGSLITAYGFTRFAENSAWPVGEKAFNSMPFLGEGYPLMYVALMTFLLIISSVTMVLAVEAGHRKDNRGVLIWMALTVVGGIFFVGSQAWEWSHFIHGSGGNFMMSKNITVQGTAEDGSEVSHTVSRGDLIYMNSEWGHHVEHEMDAKFQRNDYSDHGTHDNHAEHGEHEGEHAVSLGMLKINKYNTGTIEVDGAEAQKLWDNKEANTFTFGANLVENEYGRPSYSRFFFFITGFHGFHVFSGVVINLIIFLMAFNGVFKRTGHYEMVEKAGLYWHFVDLVWVFVFTFFYLV